MSKRQHHSDGEENENPILAAAAKADKENKAKGSGPRSMSLRSKPQQKDNKQQNKDNARPTRTMSLRNPQREQLKINEKVSNCKKLLKNNGNYEFICCYTLQSKKTFILTPTHFVLAKKNFKPEDKDSFIFPWYYIKQFKVSREQVDLEFKPLNENSSQDEKLKFKLKFEPNQYDEGVGRLCNTLQNILIPRELRVLKFYNLDAPRVQISALSALYRFKMLNSVAKLNSKTTKQIEDIIIYSQPELDVSSLPEEADKTLPVIYKLLPFLYNVQTLKIPPNSLSIDDALTPIKDSTSLYALRLSGECGKSLQEFLKYITQAEDRGTQLSGVIFNKSNFNSEDIESISDFVSKSKVKSIGFNSAIRQESIPDFYSNFLTSKVTDYLLSLNLDGTLNLDVEKIFPRLRKVALLSLESCDLNIFSVFQQLTKYSGSMNQLQMINLSNNILQVDDINEFPSTNSNLPARLTGIVVNGITWGDHLKNFFEFVFSHVESKLKLSIKDSEASDSQWEEVFNFFDESEYTGLSELVWDNNPIQENLFAFLEKNTNMIRLQMNGCLTDTKENEITAFCNFIKKASSLEGLVVRGDSSDHHLGKFTANVIEAAKEAKELVLFDLGDSRVGEEVEELVTIEDAKSNVIDSLQQILLLCKDLTKLQYLNYDGMAPSSADPYVATLQEIKDTYKDIKVSFPIYDLENLVAEEQITSKQLRKLQNQFSYLQGYDFPENQLQKTPNPKPKEVDIYPWLESIFSKPSSLYRLYDPPSFPYYVNYKVQDKLKKSSQQFSFAIDQEDNDDLRWDPKAQQPDDLIVMQDNRNDSDQELELKKTRSTTKINQTTKKRLQFGSVRIPHKSMITFQKGSLLKSASAIENETKKANNELAERQRKAREERKEKERKEREEQEQREKEEKERRHKEEEEEEERRRKEEERHKEEEEEEERRRKEEERKREEEEERRRKEEERKREEEERKREEEERKRKEEERQREERLRKEEEEEERERERERKNKIKSRNIKPAVFEEEESQSEPRQIVNRNINLDNSDSYVSAKVTDSNESDNKYKKKPLSPASSGLSKPPIPLKRSGFSSADILEEPNYDFDPVSFFDINYPVTWDNVDKEITLEGLYKKLTSEKRSDLITRLGQPKPKTK